MNYKTRSDGDVLKTHFKGGLFTSLLMTGLFVVAAQGVSGIAVAAEESTHQSKHWITEAPSDSVKDQRIEKYLRGFDQPMWEVGERYGSIVQAIKDQNFDLAAYHWDKIKVTIENGLMKRPARRQNAEAILLNNTWAEVKNDFTSRDLTKAKQGLVKAKAACMACHAAENVTFINNQPLFTGQ